VEADAVSPFRAAAFLRAVKEVKVFEAESEQQPQLQATLHA